MKKLFKVIATLLIVLSLVACSGGGEAPADGGEEPAATGVDPVKSVVYITQYGEAAPFTAMCVTGVKVLEQEGWDVKILEVKETSEFADQIRAMAAEGYHVIVTEFDALGEVALQLADD